MHYRARRPGASIYGRRGRDHLKRQPDSGQKGQNDPADEPVSGSSPQITHDRVMGSLRSSISFTLRRQASRWEEAFARNTAREQ